MKKVLLSLLTICLFIAQSLFAQTPSRVTIKGIIKDTLNENAAYATVMLLNPVDSTLVSFTTSNDAGAFTLANVKNIPYLLKISHVSYLPLQIHLDVSPAPVNDLKTVIVKPLSQTLVEVVIKAAKAPLYIKGDTIEYDATTFKIPPGSSVEDLLRRLPGIEVDAEGNISTQGKDIKKITVDGKSFFGDDPKSVTKNLEAEAISKVQVFDEKSEQAKLTGIDDGEKEKMMNLALKDEYKKGSFGKITAGAGDQERWALRGNYNRFDEKNQLSFIGYGNNINQTGVNWEDYGEFKGQNTFNEFDNGDFGFSNGGGRGFYFTSEGTLINNFDGRGYTKNGGAGVNYNFDNTKTKFNASYFYNQTRQNYDQFTYKQTFLSDSSYISNDTLMNNSFRGNHSFGSRFEKDIDSNNLIIAKANVRFSKNNPFSKSNQLFSTENDIPINKLISEKDNDLDSWNINTAAIYRHLFKQKGRSFAASVGYNNSLTDKEDHIFNMNQFFSANNPTEQIRQLNLNNTRSQQIKSSLLYTQPIVKGLFAEVFTNFTYSTNNIDRLVKDSSDAAVDSLCVYFDQKSIYGRIGSSIRYGFKGLNVSVGGAYQILDLSGEYSRFKGSPVLEDPVHKQYPYFIPNVNATYQLGRKMWLSFGYQRSVDEPAVSDLQPIPNVDNPLYKVKGNQDLKPADGHGFHFNFNYWDAASFSNVGIGGNYNKKVTNIVYNQTIEYIEGLGMVTTSQAANMTGGYSTDVWSWMNFPIIKTKLSLWGNVGLNFNNSPTLINNVENITDSKGYNINAGLNITPSQKLLLDLETGFNNTDIRYSIQTTQNQKIRNWSAEGSIKWQFYKKLFFESRFSYNVYKNDKFGFNQEIPLWNASVRKLFGKKNKIEVRFAAFDIFNKRVYISQFGSENYVFRTNSPTLARYFLLSFTYNLKGFEDKLSKNNWW